MRVLDGVEVKVIDLETAEGREEFASISGEQLPKEETRNEFADKQGVFEFVVLSHVTGMLPGEAGYEKEKDRLMIGFRFGNLNPPSWLPHGTEISDVTAYDFLTNPRTGKRAGQQITPHGSAVTNLKNGITSWSDLPPLAIWKSGRWLSQIIFDDEFDLDALPLSYRETVKRELKNWPKTGVPQSIYNVYVTSGEGTTGNNLYRLFEVPEEVCGREDPHHPLMWPERLKRPTGTYFQDEVAYKGESWRPETLQKRRYGGGSPSTHTVSTPKPTTPTIPAGVRLRCPGCGHWYSYQDLIQHSAICGDVEKLDWALMCHSDCGCRTLDQASTPKPGFPRPKKEAGVVDTGGDSEDSAVSPGDAGGTKE